jgi:photosystem II stability/assembly factor-like uncharacterized protein
MHKKLLLLLGALLPLSAFAATVPQSAYQSMQWRLVGPFRAGWATAVSGVPGNPEVWLFDSADGGVWKSSDDGVTWHSIFDAAGGSSIGALAVAPSDANTIYVGTGQVATRYDIASGNGVYKSTDGGKTWQHMGLAATRHIGRILVDPHHPDTVLVAALGRVFGPSSDRGVYRSDDGGKTWEKTLYVNADTGIVDLAFDSEDPSIVYAAAWQERIRPWLDYFEAPVGAHSGIYKSTDDGRTWQRLSGNGLPGGALGRIGVAVARGSHGRIVDAAIQSDTAGGVYRSDDAGAHWTRVNDSTALASSYFGHIRVAPNDPNTIYIPIQSIHRSTDGGKTFTIIKGAPGGDDYHTLWISPDHPERMITGADQGAVVTVNAAKTWSSWYNQPTGQFYHVETDNRFPYWIYGGQQDSGTVAIKNRSDYGEITYRDWYSVGGDERDFDIPDPRDANIVYASGLGGHVNRFDARTGQSQNISPWPISTYAARPNTVKNRYTWFTPMAIRHKPPYTLYVGAQHLFATTDEGEHWEKISPDLTGARQGAKGCNAPHVPISEATACGFGVIYSIEPSPADGNEIWIGTDNGRVQLTRDNGKTWHDVTPKAVRDWSKIASVDASVLDPAVAYIAVDRHRVGDFTPHVYRTHDYGRTWTSITAGLPHNGFINVVRADPQQKGLLYAGTNTGAYVSFDDGGHWQPLSLNLPATSVRDLTIHAGDLVAATLGRAFWVLDDLSPLRQIAAGELDNKSAYLFKPATAIRIRRDENRDTPLPPEEPAGQNPPAGAIIDYYLKSSAHTLSLAIYDGHGKLVRRYASNQPPQKRNAFRYFAKSWVKPAPLPDATAGEHRFVWNLRYPLPDAIRFGYTIAAVAGENTPLEPQGALVLPGRYEVKLTVDGRTYKQPLTVEMDPRVHVSKNALQEQLALEQKIEAALAKDYTAYQQVRSLRAQLDRRKSQAHGDVVQAVERADVATEKLLNKAPHGGHDLSGLNGRLTSFYGAIGAADRAPTAPQREAVKLYLGYLDHTLAEWRRFKSSELAHLNAQLRQGGLKPITDLTIPPPDHAPAMPDDID